MTAPTLPFCAQCSFTELMCDQCGVGFFERMSWSHYSTDEKALVLSRASQRVAAMASLEKPPAQSLLQQ